MRSGDAGASRHLLQTLATAADAPALRRLLPAIVAVLRDEADAGVVASMSVAPSPATAASTGTAPPLQRLAAVLRVVDALVANPALPLEACAEELLALVTSLAIHRAPPGAPQPPTAQQPPSADGKQPYPVRAAAQQFYQTSGGAYDTAAVEAQLRLRSLAGRVLALLVARVDVGAPPPRAGHARGFTSSSSPAAAADAGDAAAAVRLPLATLLMHVLTAPPSAAAAAAAAHGAGGGEEFDEDDDDDEGAAGKGAGGDVAMAVAAGAPRSAAAASAPSSLLASLPRPSPSVYGAAVALGCVGGGPLRALLLPVLTRLLAAWGAVADDVAGSPACDRAWAQHCVVALQRVACAAFASDELAGAAVAAAGAATSGDKWWAPASVRYRRRPAPAAAAAAAPGAASAAAATPASAPAGSAAAPPSTHDKRVVAVTLVVLPPPAAAAAAGDAGKAARPKRGAKERQSFDAGAGATASVSAAARPPTWWPADAVGADDAAAGGSASAVYALAWGV